jgi:hypothetical protein
MKKVFTTGAALVTVFTVLASPAFAAARHRAPVANDAMAPYERSANEALLARPADVVAAEGRIVGADPDLSIRTELLRDRSWSEY